MRSLHVDSRSLERSSLSDILSSIPELHDSGSVDTAHSLLLELYCALQSGMRLDEEVSKFVSIGSEEPSFALFQELSSRGIFLYIYEPKSEPYCTLCCANLLLENVKLTDEYRIAAINQLYGRPMKETERQQKLQEIIERARRLSKSANVRRVGEISEPYRSQVEAQARKLLIAILDKVFPESLSQVDDGILEKIAHRIASLLISRYRLWLSKNPRSSKFVLTNFSEIEYLKKLQLCVERFPSKGEVICREVKESGLKANIIFHEDVKKSILRIFAVTALRLGKPSLFIRARRTFTYLMKFLGADGQCHVKSMFDLVNIQDIVENFDKIISEEPDFMKNIMINSPDAFRLITLKLLSEREIKRLKSILLIIKSGIHI